MKARLIKSNCDMSVCRLVRSTFAALALLFGFGSYAIGQPGSCVDSPGAGLSRGAGK